MGYIVANIGKATNVATWDIRCDTVDDFNGLNVNKIPTGSTAYILTTQDIYILNTKDQWVLQ